MAKTAAPAQPGPKKTSLEDLFGEMNDWSFQFQRAVGLYLALTAPLGPQAGRKKGLPIFTVPVTANGVNKIEACLDLRHLKSDFLQHVLVPLAHIPLGQMAEAIEEMETRFVAIKAHLSPLLVGVEIPEQPTEEEPAEGEADEE